MQKTVAVANIGEILIKKIRTSKSIRLLINIQGNVVVTIPLFVDYADAIKFAIGHNEWITQKLSAAKEKKNNKIFCPESLFATEKYKVVFEQVSDKKLYANIIDNKIIFFYNESIDFQADSVQVFIQGFISKALTVEATEIIIPRALFLKTQFNICCNSIKIGTAKTRWGCCDKFNNIIFSNSLIMLPPHLIDFVILHEFAHTIEKNHSKNFHKVLDNFLKGTEKQCEKEIKKYSTEIKPQFLEAPLKK